MNELCYLSMHHPPSPSPPTVQTRETEKKRGGIRRTKHWPPTLPAKAPAPTNRLARPLPFYHIQNSKWWQGLLISLSQTVSVLVMWKRCLCRPNEREPPYNRRKNDTLTPSETTLENRTPQDTIGAEHSCIMCRVSKFQGLI